MDLDIMLFQELAFTVGLSVVIYFILCKFHSNASLANMGFCCVDATVKAEKLEVKGFVDEGIVGGDDERVEKVADQREVGDEIERVEKEDEIVDEVVDESPVRRKLQEIEVEGPLEEDFREIHIEHGEIEGSVKMEGDEDSEGNEIIREEREDNEEGLFDDEWEGIERTELEKAFGTAVVFVDSKANADQLDNGVKMQLYGLHKVATDGPCCRTQPMALKLSARAKWNAWQRLGEISREEAMEQYIALLSRSITDWKDEQ